MNTFFNKYGSALQGARVDFGHIHDPNNPSYIKIQPTIHRKGGSTVAVGDYFIQDIGSDFVVVARAESEGGASCSQAWAYPLAAVIWVNLHHVT